MQKICVVILLSALLSHYEALPQTKWSRPIRNTQGRSIRERRQFSFGEWVPLSQPCPTCRSFADPIDVGLRNENIGLTPPRPPTVTRQIHGEANFFPDESSILSVPPPPPSAIPRHPSGNFQFSSFGTQFSSPLPTQQIFPQNQQIQFLPQAFLPNQQVLVNNQQILPGLNQQQNNVFGQDQSKQQVNTGKVINFNSNFKTQKIPQNIVLEQNSAQKQTFSNKPQPFTQQQQTQQQAIINQPQHSFAFGSSVLTPPPAPNNTQNIVIPGLEKEEIQLLYVPVETLRQRGTFRQQQLINQDSQNIQFQKRPNNPQRPVSSVSPTKPTPTTQGKDHFVEQNKNNVGQTVSTYQVTTPQPFSSTVSPSTVLFRHVPFQQTPQPFVSATPVSPSIQPFVTPSLETQKFSPFTPETTLPQLSTIPNTIQFSPQDIEFGTTPKTILNKGVFQDDIINGKSQFSALKSTQFLGQEQPTPTQHTFSKQQETASPQSQQTAFFHEQQKQITGQNNFPQQIDQQRVYLQRQQEQQRLLREQEEKERQLKLRQQKELETQRLLQQRQKELEEQRFLEQKQQKEQLLLQQKRQKELEQQRFLQQQKERELEQQRFLQQQKEKELEQQQFLQQQKEKELEQQRILLEQQKEFETQRRIQLQKQKELEEKRRLQQLKQKQEEEQQRLLRIQKQQEQREEQERQKLLQRQQEQQRLLLQQKLQKQKEENALVRNQQQIQYLQQQQQKQTLLPQVFQQSNRHVLPAHDNLNLIPQVEKETELENKELVPHQPPLSVFYRGPNAAESQITDVLRELRSSKTIIVLDQYFEKMPKVFVGPAGLIPPSGYRKFELPYLSNLETNRIERRIDKLPFFVAPVNFVPPPGYAKILFPAPHVGSVVVSSEFNPAMKLGSSTKENPVIPNEENNDGSFSVVGPELPGLINSLETETTTIKPVTFASTPSLPQTTAQLRSKRPNNSIYKPQTRKAISKTRPQTTSKPEDVTQSFQRTETAKDSSEAVRKPFNRFLHRRRQQTTTESSLKNQGGKSLENRHYSVEVYHQEKNIDHIPKTQQKNDVLQSNHGEQYQYNEQSNQKTDGIDRSTPGSHGGFQVQPTPEYYKTQTIKSFVASEAHRPENSDYSDINLQTFEDGPLPTGSAKTITHELYRPNSIGLPSEEINVQSASKPENTEKFQSVPYENANKFSELPTSNPTAAADHSQSLKTYSEDQFSVYSTPVSRVESEDGAFETGFSGEVAKTEVPFTQSPNLSGEEQTKSFLGSGEEFTSALAELSKHHKMTRPTYSPKSHQLKLSNVRPTQEVPVEFEAPAYQEQHSKELGTSNEEKSVQFTQPPSRSPNEPYLSGFDGNSKTDYVSDPSSILSSPVSPTAPGAVQDNLQTSAGDSVDPKTRNYANTNQHDDQRINSFISLDVVHSTPESVPNQSQYFPSPTPSTFQVTVIESEKYPQYSEQISSTPDSAGDVNDNASAKTQGSENASTGLRNHENTQISEVSSQNVVDGGSTEHELKLPNPSIVKVRTRGRNRSRGQVNFAASQSTTPAPYTRLRTEHKNIENNEEQSTKTNHFRDYQPVKNFKTNQYRGLKKPIRTTTETATESEYKSNVYTIRPQRRPTNPSTVSTKRIRRPTTPIPSVESATEAFGLSTSEPYYQSEHSDFSPSGVSNDVYYEHSSLSPIRQKFRKFTESAEQKSDVVNAYGPTASSTPEPVHSTISQTEIHEETNIAQNPEFTAVEVQGHSEKFPEWNPSESGFDVSGIVLTTIRVPSQEEVEDEEPKKYQDSKKAFDPDLEKKSGRRRVRIRVHKRPHENFETAESQNLRTVANVLVPPTTTYKPNDESSFHLLAKNADFSFGGQKLFGSRSREYFKKRLNLTQAEGVNQEGKNTQSISINENSESKTGLVREGEAQKNRFEAARTETSDASEESKVSRPKLRGVVRKVIKHGHASKEESKSNESAENEETEGKQESAGVHLRQHVGANFTGRFGGIRQKGFVRFIKKNKVKTHETEFRQDSTSQEQPKPESTTTEAHSVDSSEILRTESENDKVEETKEQTQEIVQSTENPETQHTQRSDTVGTKSSEQTESFKIEDIQVKTSPAPKLDDPYEVSSENLKKPDQSQFQTSLTPQAGLYLTQKPKFYQTLRPLFYRPSQSGFQRTREQITTEQTVQNTPEKKESPVRPKYGKTTGFGIQESGKQEEIKRFNEQQQRNKNQHTQEVRKYLRTKSRDGVFSQFSKNKYFTHQKIEKEVTTKESSKTENEEITPLDIKSSLSDIEFSSSKPTTEPVADRTDLLQAEEETTKNTEESEVPTTTETVESSSEEEEESSEEEGATNSVKFEETTTEFMTELPTFIPQTSSIRNIEKIERGKVETENFDSQPDIYRFSKSSFSFDETEKFTGTKNRAHVRNITTDIIENTASFSAPGVEKHPEIRVVTHELPTTTESQTDVTSNQKTEESTAEYNTVETTTDLPETAQTQALDTVTKAKIAKVLKTSTTTKISHETEICYKGKCIRTKSENPDEDLKKLVGSASIMKIEKAKT